MKKTLTIFSILLTLSVLVASVTLSAGAVPLGELYGDVSNDDWFDIDDVTLTQRHLAKIIVLDALQLEKADYDHDGDVTSVDVTVMQRALARMDLPEGYGGSFYPWTSIRQVYADYGSGKVMTGVPVTVTAQGSEPHTNAYGDRPDSFFEPVEYRFEISQHSYTITDDGIRTHDEILATQEFSTKNSVTYTFKKAGNYTITIQAVNRFGCEDWQSATLTVTEPYSTEQPVITSVITDKGNSVELLQYEKIQPFREWNDLTVSALTIGGSGEYEYAFELITPYDTVTQDYSESDSFTIGKAHLPGWAEYTELNRRKNEYISEKFREGAHGVEIPHEFYYDADNYAPYDLIIKVKDSSGSETSETVQIAPIYNFDYVG